VPTLRDTPLLDASVPRSAMFRDAARALAELGISALAVLDEEQRVAGLFTHDDLLRGLFPRYLQELRHTAFLDREPEALGARMGKAAAEPVTAHMQPPVVIDVETTPLHVAERFLHCEWGALPVVEQGRYLGMLDQVEFCRAVMARREGDSG
jgi:CBS-domain-containing membrane protein